MKKAILAVLGLLILSCSSNDDGPSFDVDLLFGQWFENDRCNTQNYLTLNSDYTYVHLQSNNISCDTNELNTYKYTETFTLKGDNIIFNELTSEIIINETYVGTIDQTNYTLVYSKIIILNENDLFIERKFNDPQNPFRNWSFSKKNI